MAPTTATKEQDDAELLKQVPTRLAPAPIASGISQRKTAPVSIAQISKTVDHWVGKARGDYAHPSTRWLFEMSMEVKALIEPLKAEERRKEARTRHLEEILAQWNEVFGGPGVGELASPASLAQALREQKETNERLNAELGVVKRTASLTEQRCMDVLAQHHAAHAACIEREAIRHAEEVQRLREVHAAQIKSLASQMMRAHSGGRQDEGVFV